MAAETFRCLINTQTFPSIALFSVALSLLHAIQAHEYFKGVDFEALLRREIAMKPEWVPVINGEHDASLFDPKTHKMVRLLLFAHPNRFVCSSSI
jgi:hypothetical protein